MAGVGSAVDLAELELSKEAQALRQAVRSVTEVPVIRDRELLLPTMCDFANATGALITHPWGEHAPRIASIRDIRVEKKVYHEMESLEGLLRAGIDPAKNPNVQESDIKELLDVVSTMVDLNQQLSLVELKSMEIIVSSDWTVGNGIHPHRAELNLLCSLRRPGSIYYQGDTLNLTSIAFPEVTERTVSALTGEGEILAFRGSGVSWIAGRPVPDECRRSLFHRRAHAKEVLANPSAVGCGSGLAPTMPDRIFISVSAFPSPAAK